MKYESNPIKIRKNSFKLIEQDLSFDHLDKNEKQIALQMIEASGDLAILDNLRFSENAVEKAFSALRTDFELLCDTDAVVVSLKQKYLKDEPICLINKANVISHAKSNKTTRSMAAVDLWKPFLDDSIILIGSESTALFRLLELLEDEENKKTPALIIATPVGFTGATEAKELLWKRREELDIPCITLLGNRGSSTLAATIMNTILQLNKADLESKSTDN